MSDKKVQAALRLPGNHDLNLYGNKTLSILPNQPNYSECARIINRPLNDGKAGTLFSLSKNLRALSQANLDASHEHIVWDQSRDNIGFRGAESELGIWPSKAKGELFTEDISQKNYQSIDNNCYDGQAMRQSVKEIGQPPEYRIFGFNCQEYIERIKQKYYSLTRSEPANTKN